MPSISLKKDQQVVVARTGSAEQLLKVKIAEIHGESVTLQFTTGGQVSVHSLADWDRLQAGPAAAKPPVDAKPRRSNPPYMN